LVATIKVSRPDLLQDYQNESTSLPIPTLLPAKVLEKLSATPVIEDIGEPMTACFFTRMNIDPTNWYNIFTTVTPPVPHSFSLSLSPLSRWLFEKYDGVRGFWNPLKKAFYSRHGKRLLLPQEIIDSMPDDIFLDGELW